MFDKKNNVEPIIIQESDTTEQKMEAIVNISKAIYEVAKSLNGVNTHITVSNCNINAKGAEAGIKIGQSK